MIELQMIKINFTKKAIFFILWWLFRQLFQKNVRFLSSCGYSGGYLKKVCFFILRWLFRRLFQINVRAGLSASWSLGAPFGGKPLFVHFLFYCWSLHPFFILIIWIPFLILIICYLNICNFYFLNDRCSKGG